jgi:hypothetical protein
MSLYIVDSGSLADAADAYTYQCNYCKNTLQWFGPLSVSPPDGPTITPPGLGDDDFEVEPGIQQCQLCRHTVRVDYD